MLIFETIRYKNFLSTGNSWTELKLSSQGPQLFVGKNGAGKTTLLEALSYVLFNKPFTRDVLPQLVNSINGKHCVVELEFSSGTSSYKIQRGMKPKVFAIYENGKLIPQDNANDYQKYLETEIIKIDRKSFFQVVALGPSSYAPFMKMSLPQRRELVEDILDIHIFSTMKTVLKGYVEKIKTAIVSAESESKTLGFKASEELRLKDFFTKTLEEEKKNLLAEKRAQEETIKKEKAEIERLEKEVLSFEKKEREIQKTIEETQKQINSLMVERGRIDSRIDALESEMNFFTSTETCSTCHQEITEEHRQEILKTESEKRIALEKQRNALNEEIGTKSKSLANLLDPHDEVFKQLKEVTRELNVRKVSCSLVISKKNTTTPNNTNAVEGLNASIKALDEVKESIKKNEEKLASLKEKLAYAIETEELLKETGIKSKIIGQYLPVINSFIEKYLSILDFFVSFVLDENFNETIRARHRHNYTYSSFSEGEKQRINLALLFTWREIAKYKNSVNTNLLIMDETLDSALDSDGVESLVKILQSIRKDTDVILISHKEELLALPFDNVVYFRKDKNFSTCYTEKR